jgi:ubiquinone/menaquinone biosynthesis C-methylase UbiE
LTVSERLLRLFFHHLYTTAAFTYDWVAWIVSLGQWQNWRRMALTELRSGRTLELGPGPGHSLAELCAHELSPPIGVELSWQMARLAAKRLRRMGQPMSVIQGRSQSLPLPPDSFDNALSTFPTPFIFDPKTLAEAWRVLRPGGRLVVIPSAIPAGRLPWDRLGAWLFRLTGQVPYHPQEWRSLFEAAGFIVVVDTLSVRRAEVVRLLAEKPQGGMPIAPSLRPH